MRVLHCISGLAAFDGGPTSTLVGMARAQAAAGAQVTVLTTFRQVDDLAAAQELQARGVAVTRVGPGIGPLRWHPTLAGVIRRMVADHDVIHVHGLWESIQRAAAVAAHGAGKPFVVRPAGMLDGESLATSGWKKRLYFSLRLRRAFAHVSAIQCSGSTEAADVARILPTATRVIVPNGIDADELRKIPTRGAFRRRWLGGSNDPVALFLGRIHPRKNLELLIDALGATKDKTARLVCVGPGPTEYIATLSARARRIGLEGRLHFIGLLAGEDKLQALADADVFVLASWRESFANVVLEAQAAGLPAIISDKVGIAEDVAAQGTGRVLPLDAAAWTRALDELFSDAAKRQQLGAAGQARVFSAYDWRMIEKELRALYARSIASMIDVNRSS